LALDVGLALFRNQEFERSIGYLTFATRALASHSKDAFFALGFAHLKLGRTREALQAFRRILPKQVPDGVGVVRKRSNAERLRAQYVTYTAELPIDPTVVLYEVGHGSSVGCNPLALYRELKT